MRAALVLLVLALAGCSAPGAPSSKDAAREATPSAPPPPPPPTEGAIALHEGDTWTWRVSSNESNATMETARVALVGNGEVAIDRDAERGTLRTTLDARTLAIRAISMSQGAVGGSGAFDPPLPTIVPAADHEWTGVLTIRTPIGAQSQTAHASVKFLGLDGVDVPAGRFECYRYHVEIQSDGQPAFHQSLDVWWAPLAKAYAKTASDGRVEELASYRLAP